jgi:hypothetical protein
VTISENDDVITDGGQRGLVKYVRGESARVLFADGTEKTVRLAKLRLAPKARGLVLTEEIVRNAPRNGTLHALEQLVAESGATIVRANALRPVPKEKPWRSRAYLEYVRSQPCCSCGACVGVQASHHGPHGVSTKPGDERAVPLCATCHLGEYHQRGTLPGRSREETDALVERVAVELVLPWLLARGAHAEVLRALAGALRERSAA